MQYTLYHEIQYAYEHLITYFDTTWASCKIKTKIHDLLTKFSANRKADIMWLSICACRFIYVFKYRKREHYTHIWIHVILYLYLNMYAQRRISLRIYVRKWKSTAHDDNVMKYFTSECVCLCEEGTTNRLCHFCG